MCRGAPCRRTCRPVDVTSDRLNDRMATASQLGRNPPGRCGVLRWSQPGLEDRLVRKGAGAVVRGLWNRRSFRRSLVWGVVVVVAGYGVLAVGATGGVIVRDEAGCPRSIGALGSVSWVDVVRVRDATYERIEWHQPRDTVVERAQLGEKFGVVTCAVGEHVQRAGYDLRNGEATFLEPGTPLYELVGSDASFRVAATDDGIPVVYEHRQRDAATGAQLLLFSTEAVAGVSFLSPQDGTTVVGRITERSEVTAFVEALKAAPVDPEAARDLPEGPRNFVALELADQPPVTLVVYPHQAVTTDGLRLPEAVTSMLPLPS